MSDKYLQPIKLSKRDTKEIAITNKFSKYSDVLPFHLNIGFPIVNYNNLLLQPNEFMLFATPAKMYKEKEKTVGFKGGSSGASVRLFKGFWLHTTARRGTPIRKTISELTTGDLIITNQRIVFLSYTNGFELKVNKISSCQPLSKHLLSFQHNNQTKTIYIERVEVLKYVYACARTSINSALKGYDLYTENEHLKNAITFEIQQEYERIRDKILRIRVPSPHSNKLTFFTYIKQTITKLIRVSFIILLLIMFLSIIKK